MWRGAATERLWAEQRPQHGAVVRSRAVPGGRQRCRVARGQARLLGCNAAEQQAQGPPVLCHVLKLGSVCQVFKL